MGTLVSIKVPDIGDFTDVKVIEITVKPGDKVSIDDPLVTIESDKASMEVPAPQSGVVRELKVKLGDQLSEGSPILVLETEAAPPDPAANGPSTPPRGRLIETAATPIAPEAAPPLSSAPTAQSQAASPVTAAQRAGTKPHASPAVRRFARDLGVDLSQVKGSGLKGRIFRSDVEGFVKQLLTSSAPSASSAATFNLLSWPRVDFAKFGPIETKPLSRIRKIAKGNLARNWVMIPHVTQFDEADVTELEAFRRELNQTANDSVRVTLLAFVLKALVAALSEFPEFNSSLDDEALILKKYFHLGFAADTREGLVVPVIRDVDKKGVLQIAKETASLAEAARAGQLKLTDIQGGCFTVSSLGGIGGSAFTPIINAPEVAILGLSKLATKPVYRDGAFMPRLILPLSLSYDHRVIDGAVAARFTTFLSGVLRDLRRALL